MKLVIYQDKHHEWRWRIKARNGRILGDSGESYKRRITCERIARMIVAGPIEVVVE